MPLSLDPLIFIILMIFLLLMTAVLTVWSLLTLRGSPGAASDAPAPRQTRRQAREQTRQQGEQAREPATPEADREARAALLRQRAAASLPEHVSVRTPRESERRTTKPTAPPTPERTPTTAASVTPPTRSKTAPSVGRSSRERLEPPAPTPRNAAPHNSNTSPNTETTAGRVLKKNNKISNDHVRGANVKDNKRAKDKKEKSTGDAFERFIQSKNDDLDF